MKPSSLEFREEAEANKSKNSMNFKTEPISEKRKTARLVAKKMIILSDFGETAEIRGSPDEKFSQAMENFKKSERKWVGRVDI